MSNLLYREYKTGCYVGLVGSALVDYNYGDSSSLACYYADLEPNVTYTLKRYDSSSRFRVATFTNDVKTLTGSGLDASIQQWWLSDSNDTITFTTDSTDIHLVVYYTNNSEYTTRVMLNTGSVADAYEAPTKSMYPPEWYMDDDQPTPIAALPIVQELFTEPYPASLWRYEGGDTPVNALMMPIVQERFTKPYPASLWRIDESNGGLPYNDLMLDVLYVIPEPPPPPPPPGPTEIPTVQPIATTEITDQTSVQWKRYTVGYTNPDLFRFRDGDLPENTKCDVFIKGTNSYRYTEERDHIDGSQTTETP